MPSSEPSIKQENAGMDLAPNTHVNYTRKKVWIKALAIGLIVLVGILVTGYFFEKPNQKSAETEIVTLKDSNVLQTLPITPINIVKRTIYLPTPDGEMILGNTIYNTNLHYGGAENSTNVEVLELKDGIVLHEYGQPTQTDTYGVQYLFFYDFATKKLTKPNLPERYASGFHFARAIPYDEDRVVIEVAKYGAKRDPVNPQPNELYLWDTKSNSTKALISLETACNKYMQGRKFVCGMLDALVPINTTEALATYNFGDACYSESVIVKYNLDTASLTLLDAFNNQQDKYKSLLGFYNNKLLIAEKETLPKKSENEFCHSTKTTRLYTKDGDNNIVTDFDLTKLPTTENINRSDYDNPKSNLVSFSSDIYASEKPTIYLYNLDTQTISQVDKYLATPIKLPHGASVREESALAELNGVTELHQNMVDEKTVLSAILPNNPAVPLLDTAVFDQIKPKQVLEAETKLAACGDVNYNITTSATPQNSPTGLVFEQAYLVNSDIRMTDSTEPFKVRLKKCVANIPDYKAKFRINIKENSLELLDVESINTQAVDTPETQYTDEGIMQLPKNQKDEEIKSDIMK